MVDIQTVYSWLKYFRGSRLATPVTTLRDQIYADIQNRELSKAYRKMEYLEASAGELDSNIDCGDIWVDMGMAYYLMGNLLKAEEYWKKAVADYPECHESAVARWLLGDVQWQIDKSNKTAMNNWKAVIREFRYLAEEAEKKRLGEDKDWYDAWIVELEKSLEEQISTKFS